MLTLDQWNAMTDQQKWDYVHALEDMIDALELEGEPDDDEDTRELEAVTWWETPHEIDWNGVG